MSTNYEGKIKVNFSKGGRYSLLMEDDVWYGLGRKEPLFKDGSSPGEGDIANFDWEANGKYRNVIEGSLKMKKGDGPSEKPTSKSGGKGKSDYQQNKDFWAKKEIRDIDAQKKISYAGALNTAIALVNAMMSNGLVTFTKKAGQDAFSEMVTVEADRLYAEIQSAPENHERRMDVPGDKGEPLPADMDEPESETESQEGAEGGGEWD